MLLEERNRRMEALADERESLRDDYDELVADCGGSVRGHGRGASRTAGETEQPCRYCGSQHTTSKHLRDAERHYA